MGNLLYGLGSRNISFELEDQLLRHLELAIAASVSRGTGLFFRSSIGGNGDGPRSISMWINPASQLAFDYDTDKVQTVEPKLLDWFTASIESAGCIDLSTLPTREVSGS